MGSGVEVETRACPPERDGFDDARRRGGWAAMPPTVSAITVTYYTGPVLWACIDGLLAQPELGELIIVINGADPQTRSLLGERAEAD
jgi:hypothetical protein